MEEITQYFPDLSAKQIEQLSELKALYVHWNAQINVISRKDMDDFYTRHVLHSLAIAKVITFKAGTHILDVGTGGGFPAIPLAIVFPEVRITAVDSIAKKIKVVKAVVETLGLTNIEAKNKRVEQLDGRFHFILGRAVTRTEKFVSWVNTLFDQAHFNSLPNGYLLLKGGDLTEELKEVDQPSTIYPIASFFDHPFFETKKLVHLTANR